VRSHGFDDSFDDYLDGTFPDRPRGGGPSRGAKRRGPRPPTDDQPNDQSAPGGHWSSWADAARGPEPYPSWLVTEAGAVDTDLGVLKTGKEADVHLVRRAVPGSEPGCLLAAKRYRSAEHRMFHRDAGYLEGAGAGLAHGDLSGYNLLVHEERLVLIDLPQVVDLVANPLGGEFLWREVRNISTWFAGRGLPARLADPDALMALLVREAF
jgi:hypothetical protein